MYCIFIDFYVVFIDSLLIFHIKKSVFKFSLRNLISLKKKSEDFSNGGIQIKPTTDKLRDLKYEKKNLFHYWHQS